MTMKRILLAIFVIGFACAADDRKKRQAQYDNYGGYNGAASYQAPRQQQPQQQYYQPQPAYGAQQPAHYTPAQPAHKQPAAPGEEDKEEGPHPLQQILEKSKFDCGAKKDGYYADSDVGCQAFHYCVAGHKHSMMCPGGTVFHQVHLNCVPADQDICSKSDKFYFVNDYLHKQMEQRGPNNTVQYHQRYYPDGYAAGDPFNPPAENQGHQQPSHGGYAQGPAYGQVPAHQAPAHNPHQPVYGAQQRPAYQQPQHHAVPQAHIRPAYQQQPQHVAPTHAAPAAQGHVQRYPQVPAGYTHQQQPQRAPAPVVYGAQQQAHPGVVPPHAQYGAQPRPRYQQY